MTGKFRTGVNPFDQGCLKNWALILFSSTAPSYMEFRRKKEIEKEYLETKMLLRIQADNIKNEKRIKANSNNANKYITNNGSNGYPKYKNDDYLIKETKSKRQLDPNNHKVMYKTKPNKNHQYDEDENDVKFIRSDYQIDENEQHDDDSEKKIFNVWVDRKSNLNNNPKASKHQNHQNYNNKIYNQKTNHSHQTNHDYNRAEDNFKEIMIHHEPSNKYSQNSNNKYTRNNSYVNANPTVNYKPNNNYNYNNGNVMQHINENNEIRPNGVSSSKKMKSNLNAQAHHNSQARNKLEKPNNQLIKQKEFQASLNQNKFKNNKNSNHNHTGEDYASYEITV